MIVANLLIKTGEGGRYLTGVRSYDLPKRSILVLRKITDDEWQLQACEPRRIDTTPENLAPSCQLGKRIHDTPWLSIRRSRADRESILSSAAATAGAWVSLPRRRCGAGLRSATSTQKQAKTPWF